MKKLVALEKIHGLFSKITYAERHDELEFIHDHDDEEPDRQKIEKATRSTGARGSRWGRLRTKPTVSVRSSGWREGSATLRVVVSSVAKSLSSTSTSAPVSLRNKELLPAFV